MIVLVIVLLIMSGESCVSTNSPIVVLRDAYCQWLTMKMVYPTVRITTTGALPLGIRTLRGSSGRMMISKSLKSCCWHLATHSSKFFCQVFTAMIIDTVIVFKYIHAVPYC